MNKSLVQQQFGATASAYTTSAPHAQGASLTRLVTLVRPQPNWKALDIATGAGHAAAALAPHVASIVAGDITLEMLSEARNLAEARGLGNMTTAVVDAEAIPYPDGSFDLVTCRIAAHHFPDVPRFIAEVGRVLRQGGTFGLVDNVSPDPMSYSRFPEGELKEAAAAYNSFEQLRDPSHVRCLTLGEWLGLLDKAHFRIEHREVLEKPMDFTAWIDRQQGAREASGQLEGILATASPALKAVLKPRQVDGRLWFSVDEAIVVAIKREADAPA